MPTFEGPLPGSPDYHDKNGLLVPFVPAILYQPAEHATGKIIGGRRAQKSGRAWALVDTGASGCIVHPDAVRALDLPVTGTLQMLHTSGPVTGRRVRVGVVIETDQLADDMVTFLDALEHDFRSARSAKIILGAIWLQERRFTYDGPNRRFRLEW